MRFNLKESENPWVLGGFLGGIALISAVILVAVSHLTAEPIAAAKKAQFRTMMSQLDLPAFDRIVPEKTQGEFTAAQLRRVMKGETTVGYVVTAANPHGYAGPIEMMVSFDVKGNILAVQITGNKETPGLGANVCERKFRKTIASLTAPQPEGLPPNPILDQFSGRSGGQNWAVRKDGGTFDYKTGATVTSRAIVAGVAEIAQFMQNYLKEVKK